MAEPPPDRAGDHGRRGRVSLIGHAHDAHTPAGTSWLLTGAVLLVLLLVAILSAIWFFAVCRFLRADAWGEP